MRALVLCALAPTLALAEPTAPSGLAVGVEVGHPSLATVRYAPGRGRLGVDAGVGTGTLDGTGLVLRLGATYAPVVLDAGGGRALGLHVGAGGRAYWHQLEPASIDELPDRHLGLEAMVAITLALPAPRLELLLHGGPGYDVGRSDSCSFASGTMTLCPHQQSTRLYWLAGLGARIYVWR